MRRRTVLLLPGLAAVAAACSSKASGAELKVVVSVGRSSQPWVAMFAENGARLGVETVNAKGGVTVEGKGRTLVVQVVDHGGSAEQAVATARQAVADGALAIISDGVGAQAVAAVTDPASLPVFVVFGGGSTLVDAKARPTVFRMAPADAPMIQRLTDYVSSRTDGSGPPVALLTDTSLYGTDGLATLLDRFRANEVTPVARLTADPTASDVATQVAQAQQAGAKALVVWASAVVTAAAVRAVRQSGAGIALYASPTAEDPFVRQQLADTPTALDGVRFVSFRITSETGPAQFEAFRKAYEKRFGQEQVGVRTSSGAAVVAPPDYAMFPYDAVVLLAEAVRRAKQLGAPLMTALSTTAVVVGANGDQRGFSTTVREGVSSGDMYFAVFEDQTFTAVQDDDLSGSLPDVAQT